MKTTFKKSALAFLTCGLAPVSYTHLDVYKRQGNYSAKWFKC